MGVSGEGRKRGEEGAYLLVGDDQAEEGDGFTRPRGHFQYAVSLREGISS